MNEYSVSIYHACKVLPRIKEDLDTRWTMGSIAAECDINEARLAAVHPNTREETNRNAMINV